MKEVERKTLLFWIKQWYDKYNWCLAMKGIGDVVESDEAYRKIVAIVRVEVLPRKSNGVDR